MTDTIEFARDHYRAQGLTERLRDVLARIAPEDRRMTIGELAAMDQFHTRGVLATKDLAAMTPINAATRVLDLGCGIGGPARYLAATFGCHVTGIDLSESFIDAAKFLTMRCGLESKITFKTGNALDLPFAAGSFDLVFLQHVAMNIENRAALYSGVARSLAPRGRLATYDVVVKGGDLHYPTPWARNASASYLLTAEETRAALSTAGFEPIAWRDDSQAAVDWFATVAAGGPPAGPTLAVVMGPDFPALSGNLARNLREGRIGILSAIAERRD